MSSIDEIMRIIGHCYSVGTDREGTYTHPRDILYNPSSRNIRIANPISFKGSNKILGAVSYDKDENGRYFVDILYGKPTDDAIREMEFIVRNRNFRERQRDH